MIKWVILIILIIVTAIFCCGEGGLKMNNYYTGDEFENVLEEFAEMLEFSKGNLNMEEYAKQILIKMDLKMESENCELWNNLSYKGKIWFNNASKNLQSNNDVLIYKSKSEDSVKKKGNLKRKGKVK